MSTANETLERRTRFHHEAVFYADDDEYVAGTVPFIEAGLEAGEAVLVAVPAPRLQLVRSAVDRFDDPDLTFVPMEEMGRNPARIIPAWVDFVAERAGPGRPARGVGEPIWHGRSTDELAECGRHEALLNLAFADAAGFQLLCPYDTSALDPATIDEAHRNHPFVSRGGRIAPSHGYDAGVPDSMDAALSPIPAHAVTLEFDADVLSPVRRRAAEVAGAAGIADDRIFDLLLAVSEAGSNSVRHGGGSGEISMWSDDSTFVCEVRDQGRISDPLAGRRKPSIHRPDGRGLWLMNQICDLVQIRALPDGQVVRLHFRA